MKRDIRWAAGLFEGEGCATAMDTGQGRTYVRAALKMTDEEPVRWFYAVIDCGTVRWEHPPSNQENRPQWRWQATGARAEWALRRMYPYLCSRRQRRISALLAGNHQTAKQQEANDVDYRDDFSTEVRGKPVRYARIRGA